MSFAIACPPVRERSVTLNLRLADLDPLVAAAFAERVRTLWEQGAENHSEPEKAAFETVRRRVGRAARWFHLFDWALPALTCFGGPFLGVALWQVDPALGIAAGAGTSAAFGGAFWKVLRSTDPRKQLEEYVLREEMGTVFPLLDLPPAEHAYGRAVLALAGLEGYMDTETARGMLRRLNDLLASDRELAARRAEVAGALAETDPAGLTARRDELARQAEQATDPETRDALAHSARMYETRIANAETFAATRDRLDAQREAILETLVSLDSTLTRIRLAPREAATPDVTQLQQSLTDVTNQTRSVEQAVQEVIGLRSVV